MFCRNCGKELIGTPEICITCGAKPLAGNNFCHACGSQTNPQMEICPKCGARLAKAIAEEISPNQGLSLLCLLSFLGYSVPIGSISEKLEQHLQCSLP